MEHNVDKSFCIIAGCGFSQITAAGLKQHYSEVHDYNTGGKKNTPPRHPVSLEGLEEPEEQTQEEGGRKGEDVRGRPSRSQGCEMGHGGERRPQKKPFPCAKCDYKSRHRWNLREHQERHRTSKELICNICGERFKFRRFGKSQMNKEHKVDRFFCIIADCGVSRETAADLKQHYKEAHVHVAGERRDGQSARIWSRIDLDPWSFDGSDRLLKFWRWSFWAPIVS